MRQIDTQQERDDLFPWPTPGNRSMTRPELEALRLRVRLSVQRALSPSASVCHVPLESGSSAGS